MLEELVAAEALFIAIKETVQSGGDLVSVGQKLTEYFDLKSSIFKKGANKAKNTDEFWAMEKIKEYETQLKELMIYQGRAGLWDDFLKFQSEAKRQREQKEKADRVRRQKIKETAYNVFIAILIGIVGVTGIGVVALMIMIANGWRPQ